MMESDDAIRIAENMQEEAEDARDQIGAEALAIVIEKAKEHRAMQNLALEAIKDIREMCWGYDIPSPCCPEYREHHEQMQKIIGLCDEWIGKLEGGDENG